MCKKLKYITEASASISGKNTLNRISPGIPEFQGYGHRTGKSIEAHVPVKIFTGNNTKDC
jgi:hypothetical protein